MPDPLLVVVHAQIGCDAQSFGVGSIFRKQSDADTGANPQRLMPISNGSLSRSIKEMPTRSASAADWVIQDDRKLVAARSRHCVGSANAVGEHHSHSFQQLIPT